MKTLGHLLINSTKRIGTRVLFYYTGTLAQISAGTYSQNGGALTNVRLWRRVHKMQVGVTELRYTALPEPALVHCRMTGGPEHRCSVDFDQHISPQDGRRHDIHQDGLTSPRPHVAPTVF